MARIFQILKIPVGSKLDFVIYIRSVQIFLCSQSCELDSSRLEGNYVFGLSVDIEIPYFKFRVKRAMYWFRHDLCTGFRLECNMVKS